MTTVDLRRCKFVEYQPDTVNICVWSPKLAGGRSPYVAVMRPKGGLELWQSGSFDGEKWRLLGRFSSNGLIGKSVEGLCWAIADDTKESENGVEAARRLRLFSVGLDGLVIEWDLVYLCPMVSISFDPYHPNPIL